MSIGLAQARRAALLPAPEASALFLRSIQPYLSMQMRIGTLWAIQLLPHAQHDAIAAIGFYSASDSELT